MHICLHIVSRDTVLQVIENICQDSMLRTCETVRASYVSVNYSRLLLQIYLKRSNRFFIRKPAIKIEHGKTHITLRR